MNCNLNRLKSLFKEMSKEGVNFEMPLKWGFYFADSKKSSLLKLFNELQEHSYTIEEIRKEDKIWILHISKTEILTPEKLHRRNLTFNELSEYCEIMVYDGWDVENSSVSN